MEFPKDLRLRSLRRVDKNIILAKEDTIAIIQLNRPDVLNALNRQLMTELSACLEEFRAFLERRIGIREEEFLHAVFKRGPEGRNASVC